MDGKAKSGYDYGGEIGQALKSCTDLLFNQDFEPLTLGDGPLELPQARIQFSKKNQFETKISPSILL